MRSVLLQPIRRPRTRLTSAWALVPLVVGLLLLGGIRVASAEAVSGGGLARARVLWLPGHHHHRHGRTHHPGFGECGGPSVLSGEIQRLAQEGQQGFQSPAIRSLVQRYEREEEALGERIHYEFAVGRENQEQRQDEPIPLLEIEWVGN